ncbi:transcriptional regulator [Colwellia sp. 75C3]|jgi:AcrR family transcriptional regulator|uniref:TetR/AcrR family transcriptional regulator n=1 Tax=Colwellia sp. 75C3 TaxID=888425 RepID=UPI000C33ADD8|nr:TetR/AcrR family transcriptional regulator [Colwellia sp. 75C3]PKG81007.1 transcriptional regulator [Colwellia sp. 75C3]
MNKGERTRLEILKQSIIHSSQYGLADITIGTVSKLCNLSRTGVISHFDNKEDMQIAILEYGEELFRTRVIKKAWREDPLDHVIALLENWADWTSEMFIEHQVSCPFIKAVVEFQNRPSSKVRTYTIDQQNRLISYLTHRIVRCVEQNKLTADVESIAIAYELYSLYLGHAITQHTVPINAANTLFKNSVARLLKQYQVISD